MENYKYAKTTSSIIYVGDCQKDEDGDYCVGDDLEYLELPSEYIVKESNNLEDLFDEIVDYKEDRSRLYYTYDVKDFAIMRRLNHNDKNATFYGAIWVKDKGLIFVAKLNEKGEWELIDND